MIALVISSISLLIYSVLITSSPIASVILSPIDLDILANRLSRVALGALLATINGHIWAMNCGFCSDLEDIVL